MVSTSLQGRTGSTAKVRRRNRGVFAGIECLESRQLLSTVSWFHAPAVAQNLLAPSQRASVTASTIPTVTLNSLTVTDLATDGASYTASDTTEITGTLLLGSGGTASINLHADSSFLPAKNALQAQIFYTVTDLTTSAVLGSGHIFTSSFNKSLSGISSGDQVQIQAFVDPTFSGDVGNADPSSIRTVTLTATQFEIKAPGTATVKAANNSTFTLKVVDSSGAAQTDIVPTAVVQTPGGGTVTGVTVTIPDTVDSAGNYTATVNAAAGTAGTYVIIISRSGAPDVSVSLTVSP